MKPNEEMNGKRIIYTDVRMFVADTNCIMNPNQQTRRGWKINSRTQSQWARK